MYDGGWKAKSFDKLWERIKHKACKTPVKTIKKLFQIKCASAPNADDGRFIVSMSSSNLSLSSSILVQSWKFYFSQVTNWMNFRFPTKNPWLKEYNPCNWAPKSRAIFIDAKVRKKLTQVSQRPLSGPGEGGRMDGQMYVCTDGWTYKFPLFGLTYGSGISQY